MSLKNPTLSPEARSRLGGGTGGTIKYFDKPRTMGLRGPETPAAPAAPSRSYHFVCEIASPRLGTALHPPRGGTAREVLAFQSEGVALADLPAQFLYASPNGGAKVITKNQEQSWRLANQTGKSLRNPAGAWPLSHRGGDPACSQSPLPQVHSEGR